MSIWYVFIHFKVVSGWFTGYNQILDIQSLNIRGMPSLTQQGGSSEPPCLFPGVSEKDHGHPFVILSAHAVYFVQVLTPQLACFSSLLAINVLPS